MAAVGKLMQRLANDGYFGKQDLAKAATSMLDGKGITKTERKQFLKAFAQIEQSKTIRVTPETHDAFEHIKARTKGFSAEKGVYAPTLDKEELKDILSQHKAQRSATSGGEYSSGARATSGGE